jgi:ATP-dependent Clp protease ATP-binding subunit ClpA
VTPEVARDEIRRLAALRSLGDQDADALRAIGIDLDAVRAKVEESFGAGALERAGGRKGRQRGSVAGHIPFTPRAKKVLELSLREALRLEHNWIGPEHVLLGLLREGHGLAMQVLTVQGVSPDALRQRILAVVGAAA